MKIKSVLEKFRIRVIHNSSRSDLYILKVMDTAELELHGIHGSRFHHELLMRNHDLCCHAEHHRTVYNSFRGERRLVLRRALTNPISSSD